jgi:hypothetical protein
MDLLRKDQARHEMFKLLGNLLSKIGKSRTNIAHPEILQEQATKLAESEDNLVIKFTPPQIEYALKLIKSARTNADEEVFPVQPFGTWNDEGGETVANEEDASMQAGPPSKRRRLLP